jgi:hypothetical protein
MRKHITQGEVLRIKKLVRAGVTDRAEIQASVFVHSDCIDAVLGSIKRDEAKAKTAAPKKKATPKAVVDPLS